MSQEEAQKSGYLNVEPGIKLDQCWPYQIITGRNGNSDGNWIFPDNLSLVNNNKACWNCTDPNTLKNKDNILFKIREGGVKNLLVMSGDNVNQEATIKAIQYVLQANGPMVCGFQIYGSFMDYWKYLKPTPNKKPEKLRDIYMFDPNSGDKSEGGHAVTIVGWGTFPNTDTRYNNGKPIRYWVMRNSWGATTADGGYGYIAFTTDWKPNVKLQVDVPESVDKDDQGNVIWEGGMFAITPGAFPENYLSYIGNTSKVVPTTLAPKIPSKNTTPSHIRLSSPNNDNVIVNNFNSLNTLEKTFLIIIALVGFILIGLGIKNLKF